MYKSLLALIFTLMLGSAHASYIVSTFNTPKLNPNLSTRIMIAGSGDDLGLLFEEVAKAKALKYSELNPNEQIVFFSTNVKELGSEWALKKWGFNIVRTERATIDGKILIEELLPYKKILSIDIFSHSSAQFGIHLEGRANKLSEKTKGLEVLKPNFAKDAFVYLHGCNSGFVLAPYLSNIWGIPVAGSLTSTNFQKLHSDGNFYLSEEGYAPNSDWAKENTLSYDKALTCVNGTCQRLKPDNTPYTGFWGSYREGGLPFYKFFCAKNSEESCTRVMAKSLLTHSLIVNLKKESSLEEYKKGVVDFLCPVSSKKDLRGECQAKLEEALVTQDYTYNPFSRPQIECDFKGCKAEISCDKVLFTGFAKPGTCSLVNSTKSPATTLIREYKAYLQGFAELSK